MIRHARAPHRLWEAEPGESDDGVRARLADDLEQLIVAEGPRPSAAFIAEPIQAAGGVIVPPETATSRRSRRCSRRHDVLLIADEVICGFGRLG